MQEPACNAYLDNAATTPVIDEAIEAMNDVLRHAWGNPSSSHRVGYAAKEVLEQSRATIAECLGVDADEIFFTSGETEANNLAVRGACMARKDKSRRIVIELNLFLILLSVILHQAHRCQNLLSGLIRSQKSQTVRRRKFQIATLAIRQKTGLLNQIQRCSRNRFYMNIALKPIFGAQQTQGFIEPLHRIIRILLNAGT